MALPRLPHNPVPFTVRQYLPYSLDDGDPTVSTDPRQHAVALVYVVPIQGDVRVDGDCLGFDWFTLDDAQSPDLARELTSGHAQIINQLVATCR